MKYVILDTGVLINNPKLIAQDSNEIKLIIPTSAISELLNYKNRKGLTSVVELAAEEKLILIRDLEFPKVSFVGYELIDSSYYNIAGYQRKLEVDGLNALIATDDAKFTKFCKLNSIPCCNSRELIKSLKGSKSNSVIERKIKERDVNERVRRYLEILAAIANLIGIFQTSFHFTKITDVIPFPLIIVILIIVGFYLYTIREKYRLTYAIIELGVGCGTIVWAFYPNFDVESVNMDAGLKVLAGLYIIVRGMDNLAKSLEGKSFETTFKKLFFLD